MARSTSLLALFLFLALPAGATRYDVSIVGTTFNPALRTIAEGDTVRWINNSGLFHTSTSGNPCTFDGLWDSPTLGPGDQFSFVFNNAGTFPYFCRPHCFSGMTGTVTVNPAMPVEPSTWGRIKALYDLR